MHVVFQITQIYSKLREEPKLAFSRTPRRRFRIILLSATAPVLIVAGLSAQPAWAQCSASGSLTANSTVTCSGSQTAPVGQGPGADGVNLTVNDGANVTVTNANAISLGNNATVTLGSASGTSPVTVQATTNGGGTSGNYGDGDNAIDIGSNSTLIINRNASVIASGTQTAAEAINPDGAGNQIVNFGLIQGGPSSALYFQNINTNASSPPNLVDNFGTIQVVRLGSTTPDPTGQAIGSVGSVGIYFVNETGAKVVGNLQFQGGDDHVTLDPGSVVTGNFDGGGGTNTLTLNASASSADTIAGEVQNFQFLNKTGAGLWTVTGGVGANNQSAPLAISVIGGTLALTGNNSSFNGSIVVNPGANLATPGADPTATLEARAQSLPPLITDHGVVLINQVSPDGVQPNDGSYAGLIQGTGVLTKIGSGTLTLAPNPTLAPAGNTYSGGTNINAGTISVATDNALGARSGPLTFNGGTLQFAGAFALSPNRAITLNAASPGLAGGGTLDTQDYTTTLTQGITGAGGLTKAGSGTLILTGSNAYGGGTTIGAGVLQLGNGGTTGSIVGNVANAGTLVFDRADTLSFPGIIAGTGGVAQIGGGTTILTAASSYTGPTTIAGGALEVDGSIASPTSVLASGMLRGSGTIFGDVGNSGIIAPGNPASLGTLTIAGNYADPGGNVTLRTLINAGGPGNQLTDRLLITGNVSGTTSVTVQPISLASATLTGGTPTSGISIIQVGGTAAPNSFVLQGGYVAGGPYQYRLFSYAQGVSSPSEVDPKLQALGITSVDDYRLQSTIVAQGSVGPNGEAAGQKVVVPQVAAYRVLPTAALMYGAALSDDLHRRLGETDYPATPGTAPALPPLTSTQAETFVRLKGWTGNFSGNDGRPGFNQDIWFVQAGLGVVTPNVLGQGDRLHLDAVVSQGGSDVTVTSNHAKLQFAVTSIGGTATYQVPKGGYVDAVLLGNFYSGVRFSTDTQAQTANTTGTGVTASVESGYPIPVGLGVVVEPRTSITYQSVSFAGFDDADGVIFHQQDTRSLVGRVGARVLRSYDIAGSTPARLAPFVSVDFTNDFLNPGKENLGGVNFSTSPLGTAMRVGGGANAQIGSLAAYVDVGRTLGLGNGSATGWDGTAGVRFAF
jgi:outer membrane autotransporter protein